MGQGGGAFIGQAVARAEAGGFELGHWLSPRTTAVEPHGHEEGHFIFITAGDFVTEAGAGEDGPLLIFNPPGTFHRDHFRAGGAFFSVKVPPEAQAAAAELSPPRSPTRLGQLAAVAAMERLIRETHAWDGDAALSAEAACLELLAGAGRGGLTERRPPRWLAQAADLLRDGAGGVAAVAALIGVHPIHLARTFRAFHRCTPGEYLRACRLRRAAGLLCRTRMALADIAHACGYADQSHLTRSFARAHGVAPDAFRRMIN
ncbi:AraC family transcriptional regulator [Caulobacter ginsengisoli]|uniref:AraC family transcriptional regulator n=1 Tax=Caulobacter ginsengisoli TaxID=400775 RepID=A0ABU0IMR3_9CAUL|nr:helix-turn-helix transcriptional regulator [Caulobacter ginsengisoli]MDQ0463280.1 AraC family transcriptional regulator [Caulobacter ginsengisoli]